MSKEYNLLRLTLHFQNNNNSARPLVVLLEERENHYNATLRDPLFKGATEPLTILISETTTYV